MGLPAAAEKSTKSRKGSKKSVAPAEDDGAPDYITDSPCCGIFSTRTLFYFLGIMYSFILIQLFVSLAPGLPVPARVSHAVLSVGLRCRRGVVCHCEQCAANYADVGTGPTSLGSNVATVIPSADLFTRPDSDSHSR